MRAALVHRQCGVVAEAAPCRGIKDVHHPEREHLFAFVPYTMPHHPVTAAPEFDGKTGNGYWADVLAQTDAYAGELLDTVDKLGFRANTIFIFRPTTVRK